MLPARAGIVAAALVLLASTAACTPPLPSPDPPAIAWRECAGVGTPQTRCGSIRVVENRRIRQSREIEIAFAVVGAAAAKRREPVFALAGGPGDASTNLREPITAAWGDALSGRDLVLVDQRGTGASSPLDCAMNADEDPASTFGHIFAPALYTRCRAELAAAHDLNAYSTADAADDLDDVRAALAYDRVLLWGGSYGTRLAQMYMQRHGDRVAFAVLDGVSPVDLAITGRYPAHLQDALTALPDVAAPLAVIAGRLRTAPASVTFVDGSGRSVAATMTIGDFAYALRGILYGVNGAADLPGLLARAARTGNLAEFARRYAARAGRMDRALAHGLHLSVLCAEDVPFISADDERSADTTLAGRYFIDEYRAACRIWNVNPVALPVPRARPVPTLLISGRLDPVTPPSMAARVAEWLPTPVQVIAPAGHGQSFGCAAPAVAAALRQASTTALPAVCAAR